MKIAAIVVGLIFLIVAVRSPGEQPFIAFLGAYFIALTAAFWLMERIR